MWRGAQTGVPKTLRQFQSDFATEEACQQYLAACRWPDGFVCPDADISEPTNWCLNDGGSVLAAVIKSR